MKFKPGVQSYIAVSEKIWTIVPILETICKEFEVELVVTSLCDGYHSRRSKHYKGNAMDIRTRDLFELDKDKFRQKIQNALSDDYDVVLESTHLHIEYDP